MNMKMDLVTSIKNFSTVFIPSTAWLTLEHGNYVLTSPSPMELRPTWSTDNSVMDLLIVNIDSIYQDLRALLQLTHLQHTIILIIGQPFSTVDRLNFGSCASSAHSSNSPGGWWHKNCFHINLNYNYGGPRGFVHLGSGWPSQALLK